MADKITNEDLAPILAQEDPKFRALVERFDPKCWARYDLSAMRVGWHFARQEAERLAEALREARGAIEDWAGYASDYFREKHDLAGDLAKIDAALAKENKA